MRGKMRKMYVQGDARWSVVTCALWRLTCCTYQTVVAVLEASSFTPYYQTVVVVLLGYVYL